MLVYSAPMPAMLERSKQPHLPQGFDARHAGESFSLPGVYMSSSTTAFAA
jgi:hypothetical protein